jgi:hypothetical protein
MRFFRGILLVPLGLTGLIQLVEGIASIADPAATMAGLNPTATPELWGLLSR